MKFSILHTSARPDKWREIYNAWLMAAEHPDEMQYVIVCDRRWGFTELPELLRYHDRAAWNTGRRCYVDGVNIAAAYATGDVLIVNADDQYPCEHWDTELNAVLTGAYPGESWKTANFVIEVTTETPAEHERGIMVMPVLSRARYQEKGRVFYPLYESMYADNDFCEEALADYLKTQQWDEYDHGIILNARHLVFPHKHPIFDPSQAWDAAYEAQNRQEAYAQGLSILQKRRECGFGEVALMPRAKRSIACLLPGETFNQAWVGAWTEILSNLNVTWNVTVQFGHSSNVYLTRQAMADAIQPSKPDLILWIDDDQILTIAALNQMIEDLADHLELDAVFGWAWCQPNTYGNEPMLSCGTIDKEGKPQRMTYEELMGGPDDLKPVSYSGFPAALMRGSTLEKAGARAFLPIFDDDLFPPWGMSGEDAGFTMRARERGCNFVVDRRVKVPHLKLRCAEPVKGSSLQVAAPA